MAWKERSDNPIEKPLDVIFGLWGAQMLLDMKSEGLR